MIGRVTVLVGQHDLVGPPRSSRLDDAPRHHAVAVSIAMWNPNPLLDATAFILPCLAIFAIAGCLAGGGGSVIHVPDLGSRNRRNKLLSPQTPGPAGAC